MGLRGVRKVSPERKHLSERLSVDGCLPPPHPAEVVVVGVRSAGLGYVLWPPFQRGRGLLLVQ